MIFHLHNRPLKTSSKYPKSRVVVKMDDHKEEITINQVISFSADYFHDMRLKIDFCEQGFFTILKLLERYMFLRVERINVYSRIL